MDVTVPRRIRRRGTIWGVRSGQGDRNPEEEAWSVPGRRTESQQPKRSDWHRVARSPGDKTHSPGRLRVPRPSWQRTLNRTRPSPGADGCGARSALNSEPSRGRSRSLPRPRQTGAAERPVDVDVQRIGPPGRRRRVQHPAAGAKHAATSLRNASARWLMRCFSSGSISPNVMLRPSGWKIGS